MPQMPWVAFYFSDFLNDRAVRLMTYDERGRYLEVLAVAYQNPEPGIMLEDEVRRAADYAPGEWPEHREAFARAFFVVDDGVWVQKRVVAEAQKAVVICQARSEAGKRGAQARWHRDRMANASQTHGKRDGKRIANRCTTTTTESSSRPDGLEEDSKPTPLSPASRDDEADGFFLTTLWPTYPRHRGTSKAKALNEFRKIVKAHRGDLDDLATEIMSGLRRHIDLWAGKDEQFIPHAATWLHQRRWEDA